MKETRTGVNISSYPATDVAGSFFLSRRAEILNSGGFMQKYSDQVADHRDISFKSQPFLAGLIYKKLSESM